MRRGLALIIPVLLTCGAWIGCSDGYEARRTETPTPATNTAVNERDRDHATLTPVDQLENETDLEITRQIREVVVDDDSLSTLAHNVKIITIDGVVTVRGPVKTEQEKDAIYAKAVEVDGVKRVVNELEIEIR